MVRPQRTARHTRIGHPILHRIAIRRPRAGPSRSRRGEHVRGPEAGQERAGCRASGLHRARVGGTVPRLRPRSASGRSRLPPLHVPGSGRPRWTPQPVVPRLPLLRSLKGAHVRLSHGYAVGTEAGRIPPGERELSGNLWIREPRTMVMAGRSPVAGPAPATPEPKNGPVHEGASGAVGPLPDGPGDRGHRRPDRVCP